MSNKRARERANRQIIYPANLSRKDKLGYFVVELLSRMQAFILWRVVKEPVWRSSNGEVRRLVDLHDRHLENILRMVERDGSDVAEHTYAALFAEQSRRNKVKQEQRAQQRAERDIP